MGKNSLLMWNTLQIVQIYGSLNELISPYVCFIRWHSHIQHIYLAGLCPPKYFFCHVTVCFTLHLLYLLYEWNTNGLCHWPANDNKESWNRKEKDRNRDKYICMCMYIWRKKKQHRQFMPTAYEESYTDKHENYHHCIINILFPCYRVVIIMPFPEIKYIAILFFLFFEREREFVTVWVLVFILITSSNYIEWSCNTIDSNHLCDRDQK